MIDSGGFRLAVGKILIISIQYKWNSRLTNQCTIIDSSGFIGIVVITQA